MATLQLSNFWADIQPFDKFRQSHLAIASQNKKSGKATHKPTQFASHFILPQRTNTDRNSHLWPHEIHNLHIILVCVDMVNRALLCGGQMFEPRHSSRAKRAWRARLQRLLFTIYKLWDLLRFHFQLHHLFTSTDYYFFWKGNIFLQANFQFAVFAFHLATAKTWLMFSAFGTNHSSRANAPLIIISWTLINSAMTKKSYCCSLQHSIWRQYLVKILSKQFSKTVKQKNP